MFGFGSKKNKNKKTDKPASKNGKNTVGAEKGQGKSDDIRAQALANMQAARENLGEDTIQKISESINKMAETNERMAAARAKLAQEADAEMVANEILSMIETRH